MNYKKSIVVIAILFLVSCGCTKRDCEVHDISGAETDEALKILKVSGNDWMRNAMVCRMDKFEIAAPADKGENNANIIFVFKKGKPVFYRQNSGTYIYSPKLKDAAFEKVLVHIWHGGDNDNVKRLWYQTIGKEPEVMLYDINFDGQPDSKTIYENHEIIEQYKWEDNGWQRKELKNKNP